MLSFRDFVNAFRDLGLGDGGRVIAHTSLSAFGHVGGGPQTIVGALLTSFDTVIVPTFTYSTMITPPVGPENNAMSYGTGEEQNRLAEIFQPDLPADTAMGVVAETLRQHPESLRSNHPILSFAGVNAETILETQTLEAPFAPIDQLAEEDGDVLLLGVNHTVNTSIHHAEDKAGRKQFVRWALTPQGIAECPQFPGCSFGFQAIAPLLDGIVRRVHLGQTYIESYPLRDLIHIAVGLIREDPMALLCDQPDCERCQAGRDAIKNPT